MNNFKIYFLACFLIMLAECRKDNSPNISNNSFLSDKDYNSLVVEVQYMKGFQPTQVALNNFKNFLQNRLNKPGGITVVQDSIVSSGKSSYSLSDIQQIEQANRLQYAAGKAIAAYFLFLDADYSANSGNSKVLGIAYSATSMVIFEKTIRDYCGGIGQPSPSTLETTVIDHEFGHILGLVNNGTPMQANHQDTPHGRHCTVKNCLMYYNVETSYIIASLLGGIPELDAQCVADLRANGGK